MKQAGCTVYRRVQRPLPFVGKLCESESEIFHWPKPNNQRHSDWLTFDWSHTSTHETTLTGHTRTYAYTQPNRCGGFRFSSVTQHCNRQYNHQLLQSDDWNQIGCV